VAVEGHADDELVGTRPATEAAERRQEWWTGQPETYDVGHSDAIFFLDTAGRERIAIAGQPDTEGT
jgi:hypothetical protein